MLEFQALDLYRDPTEARALTVPGTQDYYREPSGARGASIITILAGAGGNLVQAVWSTNVLITAPGQGLELVTRDYTDFPARVVEITGVAPKAGPQRQERDVTAAFKQLFAETASVPPTAPNGWRSFGHRLKGDGNTAPLLYLSTLLLLWDRG